LAVSLAQSRKQSKNSPPKIKVLKVSFHANDKFPAINYLKSKKRTPANKSGHKKDDQKALWTREEERERERERE
jgi:hypothetical protein